MSETFMVKQAAALVQYKCCEAWFQLLVAKFVSVVWSSILKMDSKPTIS